MRQEIRVRGRLPFAFFLPLALLALALGCDQGPSSAGEAGPAAEEGAEEAPSADITLPEGFEARVFHEGLGRVRHIAVGPKGVLYAALREEKGGHGTFALADRDGDGRAEVVEGFGDFAGTGVGVHEGFLYRSSNTAVYRWPLPEGDAIVPQGEPELVVGGFPEQRSHAAKAFAFGGGKLFVDSGAPSNACQEEHRTKGSPGERPCPELERGGGIWAFPADQGGLDQMADGQRFATGLRHVVAMAWNPLVDELFAVEHGRDQLDSLWPEHFTAEENAELPAEEFHLIEEGKDYGWPYTYYDPMKDKRVVAPEYGGDGEMTPEPGQYEDPIYAFPAHWAPNGLLFYTADHFPERYRGGAFVAFHGSWNRAPLPQGGYNVVFVPMEGAKPAGEHEIFADGFAGQRPLESPRQARFRPMGLALSPEGTLYISDSVKGRIWEVRYVGGE